MKRNKQEHFILKRILTYAPGTVIPSLLTLITTAIFTRIFSASDYGVFGLFFVIATTFKQLTVMWLHQGIGRFLPSEKTFTGQFQIKVSILISSWAIVSMEILIGVLVLMFVRTLFPFNLQLFFLPLCLFIIVTSLFDVFGSIFTAELRAREFVLYKLLETCLIFLLRLIPVLVLGFSNIRIMFWSVIISDFILLPIVWIKSDMPSILLLLPALKIKSNWDLVKKFLSYGVPMTFWYLSSIFMDIGDRYIIKYFLGYKELGIYDANYRLIGGFAALIVMPITLSLHPMLMKIAGSKDDYKISDLISIIIENLFILGVLAVCIIFLFHRDIAHLLLGNDFRSGSQIMPIVLAGIVFFNIGTYAHKPFEIEKKTKIMVIISAISAVVNLIINFILIPTIGYIGAAYSTFIAYFFYTIVTGSLGRKLINWNIQWKQVLQGLLFLVICTLFISFTRSWVDNSFSMRLGFYISILLACTVSGITLLKVYRKVHDNSSLDLE